MLSVPLAKRSDGQLVTAVALGAPHFTIAALE